MQYPLTESEKVEKTLKLLSKNGLSLKFIKNPTEEMQLVAVKQNADTIQFINNPIELIQLEAINQHPSSLRLFINFATNVVIVEAIKKDPFVIRYIQNPTIEMQRVAIQYIKEIDLIRFTNVFTHKITDSISLCLLHSRLPDSELKNRIKKLPNWKDDANLILEVINE